VRQIADVPVGHHATLYGRAGDWFARVVLVLLAAVVARLLGLSVRVRRAGSSKMA